MSYCHLTLQNTTFSQFAPIFQEQAQVGQLLTASPLSMGLLTSSPPSWHPAPPELRTAISQLHDVSPKLPNLALGFSVRNTGAAYGNVPLVVGLSQPDEVRELADVWRELQRQPGDNERKKAEEQAMEKIKCMGYLDWSWASPYV
jgi:D-arabinose 1-dehydrogenase